MGKTVAVLEFFVVVWCARETDVMNASSRQNPQGDCKAGQKAGEALQYSGAVVGLYIAVIPRLLALGSRQSDQCLHHFFHCSIADSLDSLSFAACGVRRLFFFFFFFFFLYSGCIVRVSGIRTYAPST